MHNTLIPSQVEELKKLGRRRRRNKNSFWASDKERSEKLEELWNQGVSASKIAQAIGHGCNKNMVISEARRLGLSGRGSPIRRGAKGVPTKKKPALLAVSAYPPANAEPLDSESLPPEEKEAGPRCRWPIGDPHDKDFHFCGAPVKRKKSYCFDHCGRAYVPLPKKAKRHAV